MTMGVLFLNVGRAYPNDNIPLAQQRSTGHPAVARSSTSVALTSQCSPAQAALRALCSCICLDGQAWELIASRRFGVTPTDRRASQARHCTHRQPLRMSRDTGGYWVRSLTFNCRPSARC